MVDLAKRGWFHKFMLWFSSRVGPYILKFTNATIRLEVPDLPQHESTRQEGVRYIYAFWHAHLWFFSTQHPKDQTCVMISRHRDGEYIARAIAPLGKVAVRGSSTQGGNSAFLRMVNLVKQGMEAAVTPDGPKGPARQAKLGTILLAKETGLPIQPVGIAYRRAWRLKTWDQFLVPMPFTRVVVMMGQPMIVPANTEKSEMERLRQQLETELNQLTDNATKAARSNYA